MVWFYVVCVALILISIYFLLKNRKTLQQRLFVFLMNLFNSLIGTLCLEPYRSQMFLPLNEMTSHDPKLAAKGKGCIRLLEIGIGGGKNLKFYPNNTHLICVEPNPHFKKYFEKNIKKFPNIILEKSVSGTAEDMSGIEDNSIDVVVSTHVLCSVTDIKSCLKEVKRVLIPNGNFIYMEHVFYRSGTTRRTIQTLIEPIWKIVNDGCKLTVDTSRLINETQFSSVEEQYVITKLSIPLLKPHIFGIATK